MDMITKPEASVLTDMARAGNEYVTAALELYQSGIILCNYMRRSNYSDPYITLYCTVVQRSVLQFLGHQLSYNFDFSFCLLNVTMKSYISLIISPLIKFTTYYICLSR